VKAAVHQSQQHIEKLLNEVRNADGSAAVQQYPSLRHVDAKVREFKMVLQTMPQDSAPLREAFDNDIDFSANSRRVRLEALANHCQTAMRFLTSGIIKPKKQLFRGPNLQKLTQILPPLEEIIQARWLEAQRCQHAGAFLAAVILMGSILEALLLARALTAQSLAYQARSAPKDKTGKPIALHDWKLAALIDTAVELGWLKMDRGKFSHALRQSRNVVHPWQHATLKADFDEATCKTCWHVLNASVDDLLRTA
jgi:hypothetical protein